MATYTTNLNLKKPDGTDEALISDINSNMDTIDSAVGTLNTKTSMQILSLSTIFDSLVNNVTGSAVVFGNVITIYMQGDGIRNASSGSDIGTLKQKYRPNINTGHYIITPILSNSSPYLPVSSAWIYAGYGNIKKYGSEGFYISVTYIIEG